MERRLLAHEYVESHYALWQNASIIFSFYDGTSFHISLLVGMLFDLTHQMMGN